MRWHDYEVPKEEDSPGKNLEDRGAWCATVHGAQSQMQLSCFWIATTRRKVRTTGDLRATSPRVSLQLPIQVTECIFQSCISSTQRWSSRQVCPNFEVWNLMVLIISGFTGSSQHSLAAPSEHPALLLGSLREFDWGHTMTSGLFWGRTIPMAVAGGPPLCWVSGTIIWINFVSS